MARGRHRSRAASGATPDLLLDIESVDLEGRGVARAEGKVIFVDNALPGERVLASVVKQGARFDRAETIKVIHASSGRVQARCRYFGVCGGCSMQHIDAPTQLAIKQRVLEDQLWHLARLRPETILAPIAGPAWAYRHRARLSVRDVAKKGGVLVGFHERASSYVAQMDACEVLTGRASALIRPLKRLIESLSIRQRVPQIELAQGSETMALVFRVLEPPTDLDCECLSDFGKTHKAEIWLQAKGPDSIQLLYPKSSALAYRLADFDLDYAFRPTDFTQVNHRVNEVLVRKAVRLLAVCDSDRVLDLFCGLGNFSLALARTASLVVGLEGSEALVQRAASIAAAQGLGARTRFEAANLFTLSDSAWEALGPFEKLLLDPPREGAQQICELIVRRAARPSRIVYVSCNPATLARDAAILVHQAGYKLEAVAVANMFPQTSHVESIAVFTPAQMALNPVSLAAWPSVGADGHAQGLI
jgi:23S rRNA (uracil1939-C5)-methyltransferase